MPIPNQMRRAKGQSYQETYWELKEKLPSLLKEEDPLGLKPSWWPKDADWSGRNQSPLLWKTLMELASKAISMKLALQISRWVYNDIRAWVGAYGSDQAAYEMFRKDWKVVRNIISLQVRLIGEQVLWDKGEPWRQLNTGFKSIGEKDEARAGRVRTTSVPRQRAASPSGADAASGGTYSSGYAAGTQYRVPRYPISP